MGLIIAGICAAVIFVIALSIIYWIVLNTETYPPYQLPAKWPLPQGEFNGNQTRPEQADNTHQSS